MSIHSDNYFRKVPSTDLKQWLKYKEKQRRVSEVSLQVTGLLQRELLWAECLCSPTHRPKFFVETLVSQCDDIWGRGLWEVIRSWR